MTRTYRLEAFAEVGLDEALLMLVIDEHRRQLPRLEKLWAYYRNTLQPVGTAQEKQGRWYRQSQECGLPARLTGRAGLTLTDDRAAGRREVVIENDIAWRVQAMVDFMFGKPVSMVSTAAGEPRRRLIEQVLERIWENSGGIALLQDAALLGNIFGHVDLALRFDEQALRAAVATAGKDELARGLAAAEHIRVEIIDPRRGAAILDEHDYRQIAAYLICYERELNQPQRPSFVDRLMRLRDPARDLQRSRERTQVLEVISPTAWQTYENGRLVSEQSSDLTGGRIPVVHIQNISQPFHYEGQGEVEPLIALQDETQHQALRPRLPRHTPELQDVPGQGNRGLRQDAHRPGPAHLH